MKSVPQISQNVEIIIHEKDIVLRSGSQIREVTGSEAAIGRALLKIVDGKKDFDEITHSLLPEFSTAEVERFLIRYSKLLFIIQEMEEEKSNGDEEDPDLPQIIIFGDHPLAIMISERLSEFGQARPIAVSNMGQIQEMAAKDLMICIPQDLTYQDINKIASACTEWKLPCIFVTAEPQEIIIGPTFIPGATACFECARTSLYFEASSGSEELFRKFTIPPVSRGIPSRRMMIKAADKILMEAGILVGKVGKGSLQYIKHLESIQLTREESIQLEPGIARKENCKWCSCQESGKLVGSAAGQMAREAFIQISYSQRKGKPASDILVKKEQDPKQEIRSIGIMGGGTAGYLSALALKKRFPEMKIELVESRAIPIIGVGEATTPILLFFLYDALGFDIREIYREVMPTWKLGIRFFWGFPDDYYFNHPFGIGDIFPSWYFTGSVNQASLTSIMMNTNTSPVIREGSNGNGRVTSLIHKTPHAYHLDNEMFVTYLKKKARLAGIGHIEGKIADIEKNDNGEVGAVVLESGKELNYDFYVDCTGFRSLILEKTLGSEFESYDASLFTDRAIVANVDHGGNIRPYTLADTMDNGWVWGIPLRDSDHRGYVYSSQFSNEEQAYAEMKRTFPGMGDHRVVKFRSGRHKEFWKGNVVAIGNSYGFVEPLESTGIHMIIQEILTFIDHFPRTKQDTGRRNLLNERMAAHWDFLRWFLAIHYKYNKKKTTPFWKACQEETDISGVKELVDVFKQEGPLSYQNGAIHDILLPFDDDIIFGPFGFDLMLLAQGVKPSEKVQVMDEGRLWKDKAGLWQTLVSRALPQKEALEFLDNNPDQLEVD